MASPATPRAALADAMRLRTALRASPPARLRGIAEHWNTPPVESGDGAPASGNGTGQHAAERHHALADHLYPRMKMPRYFQPAFSRLPAPARDALLFLAAHGGELGADELRDRQFGGDHVASRAAIELLIGAGFVFAPGTPSPDAADTVAVPECHMAQIDLPDHLTGFLGALLRTLAPEDLRTVAARVLPETPTAEFKRPDLASRVRGELLDPRRLSVLVDSLDPVERELFSGIVSLGGLCLYRDLLELAALKRFDHTRAEQLNRMVASSGILFQVFEGHNKYDNHLQVPRDILRVVTEGFVADTRSLAELDPLAAPDGGAEPPADRAPDSSPFLRDLTLFAGRVDVMRIRRLHAGGINRLDLKKALAAVGTPLPVGYGVFMGAFLTERRHLVGLDDGWRASPGFASWLAEPGRCLVDAASWWLTTTEWNESTADGAVATPGMAAADPGGILEMRRIVLKALSGLPAGRWIDLDAFVEVLRPKVDVALPAGNGTGTAGYGSSARRDPGIKQCFGRILGESLCWLGITATDNGTAGKPADTAGSGADGALPNRVRAGKRSAGVAARRRQGVRAKAATWPAGDGFKRFAVTPMGAAMLSGGMFEPEGATTDQATEAVAALEAWTRHRQSWLIVQATLEVVSPPDLALPDLFQLARVASIAKIDVMSTFSLTRESLRAALEAGVRGEDIMEFLAIRSRTPLPETVRLMLIECADRHGEVRLSAAAGYVEAYDPAVMEAVRGNSRLAPHIKEVVGDKVAILAEGTDLLKVERELRLAGLMPHRDSVVVAAADGDERYHMTLMPQELCDLVAAIRLVAHMEEDFGDAAMTRGRAAELVRKLAPDATGAVAMADYVDTASRNLRGRYEEAAKARVEAVEEQYRDKVNRIVGKTMSSRGPSRFNFTGANPAEEPDDVRKLLAFAIEYELNVELGYVKSTDQEVVVTLRPNSFEGVRLYAHSPASASDGIYKLDRILTAKLL